MAEINAEWIVAQIDKYVSYLDALPQERPTKGKADSNAFYAAGLRDMAQSIREGVLQESSWADAQAFLGSAFPSLIEDAPHGWTVVIQSKPAQDRE